MNYSIQKIGKAQVEIAFDIDAKEWEICIAEAYNKNKHNFNLEGFRKGKVPRNILEKRFGKEVFYEDALDIVLPKYYSEILDKETEIEVIDRPEVDVKEISEDGVKIVLTVPVKPEFELGQYTGLEIKKTPINFSEENVENQIKFKAEELARFVEVSGRAVQNDDQIVFNFSGSIDGVLFDGGVAENFELVVGSKSFIPGFEEQLVGMQIGEEKDVVVSFPADYGASELAGKEAVFACKINQIRTKEIPAVDDEFAKDSGYDSLEDMKKDISDKGMEDAQRQAAFADENNIVETVAKNTEIEIPEILVVNELDRMLQDLEQRMSMQGLTLKSYCEYAGTTVEELRTQRHDDALNAVKSRLVLEAIIKKENFNVSAEEIEVKVAEIAEKAGKSLEEYKKTIKPQTISYVANDIMMDKIFTFLKTENKLVD